MSRSSALPDAARARPLRIVIVDDNVDAACLLAELLELHGHQVAVAHDGAAGLALFDAYVPELAILDLGLPELDGFGLAERVRADPRFRTIPLIALSAYTLPHHRQHAREVGFDHHLAKPLPWQLLEKLLAWYGSS